MTKHVILSLILVFALIIPPLMAETKVFPLEGLNKPDNGKLYVDQERIYIVEGHSVLIYSLKDFKLIKKFGKPGQGPQEFTINRQMGPMGSIYLDVNSDKIYVKSFGKASWFTKDGTYISEEKLPVSWILMAFRFGKNMLAQKYEIGEVRYITLTAYDENNKELKELERLPDQFQLGKGIEVLKINPTQAIYKDKLYVAWENELKIKVYDLDFKPLYTIQHPIKRQKVSEKDKTDIINFFKTSPETKPYYEFLKPITFPEYYPAILAMVVTGEKIYVMTFKTEKKEGDVQNYETFIFDLKGKLLKTTMLPVTMQDPIQPYPLNIHDGKVYQVVENMDEESWEIQITDIK